MPPFTKKRRNKKPVSQVKKNTREINRMKRGIEPKLEIAIVNISTDDAGIVDWLSAISKGTGSANRIGQFITGKQLKLRYRLEFDSASLHSFEYVRVMIMKQKVTFNAKPLPSVLWENLNVQSFKDQSFGQRYTVLYDRTHVLNRKIVDLDIGSPLITKTINLRNLKIGFNDNTVVASTGVGSATNQLFLVTLTSATSNGADFKFQSELTYTDS